MNDSRNCGPEARRVPGTFALLITVTFLGLSLVGCSSRLKTYPVSGKVQFESGGPVIVGTVEFQSVEHKVNARGDIQPDGSFTLSTFEDGDGAVAGKHQCVVLQLVIGENMTGHKPSLIGVVDSKFASYLSSGLEAEVSADGENEIVLTVKGVKKQPALGEGHTH